MDFEIPEDITVLKGEDLAATLTAARAAAKAVNSIADDEFTDENLERLEALTGLIEALEAQTAAETEAAEKRAAARAKAAALTAEPEEEATEEEAEDEEEAEEVEEAVTETPAEEVAEEKELITASGTPAKKEKTRVVKRAASAVTAPEIPNRAAPVITAAADAPSAGYSMGATLASLEEVTKGAMERFSAMPRGKVGNVQNRYAVAHITKQRSDGLTIDNYRSVQDLIQAASVESRLPGGSLTAAGGWCAPSETVYDLCTIESTDGLWDLPEVQVNRGGLNFTKGPSFEDFYAYAVTAFQTEAEAEAGETKVCIPVECPPFEDVRLDAAYVCISAGILTNAAYPELIRRYIEGTLIAQRHAVSARMIAAAEAITGPAIPIPDVWANALSVLHALELVAEGERDRYRMARNATLEVLLPFWVRPALRADLANRTGVDLVNVTDAMLDSFFTNRGLRVQWLYNYQSIAVTGDGVATDYPDTLETIMYPAGTFVMLTDDVIRLDAVYDSTGLSTNTYTALFAEEGVALANVCHEPRRLSIDFAVTGLTAAAVINQDFGEEPPAYVEA